MTTQCPKCEAWMWGTRHVCPPLWSCRMVGEDVRETVECYGSDASDAAEKFAEGYNEGGDYPMMSRGSQGIDVIVSREGLAPVKVHVWAEPSITYHSHEPEEIEDDRDDANPDQAAPADPLCGLGAAGAAAGEA